MAKWIIRRQKNGTYQAIFEMDGEPLWWTEGYSAKASAKNAIDSAKRNMRDAPIEDTTSE